MIDDAGGAPVFDQDPGGLRVGDDMQVPAMLYRVKEGARGADPAPPLRRPLNIGHALLSVAVIVLVQWNAMVKAGLDEGVAERVPPFEIVDLLLARPAPVGIVAGAELRLHPHEVAENIGIGPSRISELRPDVEIGWLAAVEDKPVDGTRPAQNSAPRHGDRPPLCAPASLGVIEPVRPRIFQQIHEACGNLDHRVAVWWACFQKADTNRRIFAQPVGKNAPRRSGADDDVIIAVRHARTLFQPLREDNR